MTKDHALSLVVTDRRRGWEQKHLLPYENILHLQTHRKL